jgi:hypothetical protein
MPKHDSPEQNNIVRRLFHRISGDRFDSSLDRWGKRSSNLYNIIRLAAYVGGLALAGGVGFTIIAPGRDGKESESSTIERKDFTGDARTVGKDVTTGSLPPSPQRSCIPESGPWAMLDFLAGQSDPQRQFELRFKGRRICAPWVLTVESSDRVGGVWRVKLRKSMWHPAVYADVRADMASIRPGVVVRVEGTVEAYQSALFTPDAYVLLSSARITRQ